MATHSNILAWKIPWTEQDPVSPQSVCPIWASLVAQRVKRLPTMQETWVQSLSQEDPLEKEMATPLQSSCLENPMV